MQNKPKEVNLDHIVRKDDDLLQVMELKKRARTIAVSTEDSEVRMQLRELGEPTCCFGEDAADRRERLRQVLAITDSNFPKRHRLEQEKVKENDDDEICWYHKGSEELKLAREWILEYSLIKSKHRSENQRNYYASLTETQRKAKAQEYHKKIRNIESICTMACDTRPIVHCQFSPNNKLLATASWSGDCKIFSVPEMESKIVFKGHKTKMSAVAWNPHSTLSETSIDLATSDHDGCVKLWSLSSQDPVGFVEGHEPNRVSKLDFHPSGRFLATTCYDYSWRLWDLSVGEEILHQEGHSKEVYDISFHPDGSLVLSGSFYVRGIVPTRLFSIDRLLFSGLDSFGRVWDLRSGRCVYFLEGHSDGIRSAVWSDNGCHMATGSSDNTAKIWDLRYKQAIYTIPAHQSSVTAVKFQPGFSQFILTTSYDRKTKIWAHPTWTPIKEMSEHTEKIMHADISQDCKYIATCSYDKQVKLWDIPSM